MTLGLNADTASYFYSSIKYGLAYNTYFTLGVWLGLLGCEAIYTLQCHKPFKIISNYGENFIFTYTRIQLGTQNFIIVIKLSAALVCNLSAHLSILFGHQLIYYFSMQEINY